MRKSIYLGVAALIAAGAYLFGHMQGTWGGWCFSKLSVTLVAPNLTCKIIYYRLAKLASICA